jgi:hypothetical protein
MLWIGQSVLQAFLVALAVFLAVFVPWFPLQMAACVFGAVFLFVAGRNPVFAYRRLMRLVVLAAIGVATLGTSGRISGNLTLPKQLGDFNVLVEWGTGPALWIVLALAVLLLIGDIAITVVEARAGRRIVNGTALDLSVIRHEDEAVLLETDVTLVGPAGGLTVTAALLSTGGVWPREMKCQLYERRKPISTRTIGERETVTLTVEKEEKAGSYARYLMRCTGWLIGTLLPLKGELGLKTAISQPSIVVPVRFIAGPGVDR